MRNSTMGLLYKHMRRREGHISLPRRQQISTHRPHHEAARSRVDGRARAAQRARLRGEGQLSAAEAIRQSPDGDSTRLPPIGDTVRPPAHGEAHEVLHPGRPREQPGVAPAASAAVREGRAGEVQAVRESLRQFVM
ncbi:uncharacterized protein LOC134538163 isoform X1 [Bacillus rossius redtenbacheri]|uniref:uncharacterized protein LOC134538163 isoform X1 n=1 Tax=Bacillus rossius redtenbacheri TaxID=93214 RepID=UPI002FDE42C8